MRTYKASERTRTPSTIVAIGFTLLALSSCSREPRIFSPPPPTTQTAPLAPLPNQPSVFNLPVTVSLTSIATAINNALPSEEFGSESGPAGTDISWRIDRRPVSVSSQDNSIRLTGSLGGYVRFELDLFFDDLTATFDTGARYTVDVQPRLQQDWRIVPELSADLTVTEARHEIFNLVTVSLRREMEPHVDRAVNRQVRRFETRIANDDFIERAARDLWLQLCTSTQISSDPEAWLEIVPRRFRAKQPRITFDRIHMQLGLDADTRVNTMQAQLTCPFPDNLVLEDPESGLTNIWLPSEIGYNELNQVLNQLVSNTTIGDDVAITINAATLKPLGPSLLLQVDLSAAAPNWFSRPATGSLFLLAKPQLDTNNSTITLTDVHLDIQSRNVLIEAIGEAAEPWILSYFEDYTIFDLTPAVEQLRDQANETLTDLSNLSPQGMTITAELVSLELLGLDIGPDSVRVVAAASGTTNIAMDAVPF